jgi:hypothetical protein
MNFSNENDQAVLIIAASQLLFASVKISGTIRQDVTRR